MSALWTSQDAAVATGGTTRGGWEAQGVSIDTRTLQAGDLFVALRDARDGHDFVGDALSRGAAAALVDRVPEGVPADAPLLMVGDTLQGLEALARARRAETRARVIAITGSVGKTSTKEMIRTALAPQGRVHAAEKSYNNHWGVPLTLARMPREADFAAIEIGMNAPGEIAPLSRLARPHVALITEVAEVHMQGFAALREVALEKASIVDGLEPGGVAVLNRDTRTYPILLRRACKHGAVPIRFGNSGRPEFSLSRIRPQPDATVVTARRKGKRFVFRIGAPGAHFAMNALGALAAIEAAGGDLARAALSLGDWGPPQGRGDRHLIRLAPGTPPLLLIDDSYNANPTSMRAALAALAETEPPHGRGRRVAIIGDMLELGAASRTKHRGLAGAAALKSIDLVHTVGADMEALAEALPRQKRGQHAPRAADLIPHLAELAGPGDVVMVKASLGTGLGAVVEAMKKRDRAPDDKG